MNKQFSNPILQSMRLSLLMLLAYGADTANAADNEGADDGTDDYVDTVSTDSFDFAVATVAAWTIMVITLEVNDFRHRLALAYDNNSLSSSNASNRYIASLVSIRYGLRDALFDWFIMYSIGYAIVAGCTWTNADPEAVLVIQGFGYMFSAGIMAVASFKFPQWVSLMHHVFLSTGIW